MMIKQRMLSQMLDNTQSRELSLFICILNEYEADQIQSYLEEEIEYCLTDLNNNSKLLKNSAFFLSRDRIEFLDNVSNSIADKLLKIRAIILKYKGNEIIHDANVHKKLRNVFYDYIMTSYDLYCYLFSLKEDLIESQLIQSGVLNKWVNLGVRKDPATGSYLASIFSPAILNTVVFACEKWEQLNELKPFYTDSQQNCRPSFHSYIYLQKSFRMLFDLDFFLEEEQKVFKIRKILQGTIAFDLQPIYYSSQNNDTQYFEAISQSRMAEKIFFAYEDMVVNKKSVDFLDCLITGGNTFEKDIDNLDECDHQMKLLKSVLNEMFKNNNYHIELETLQKSRTDDCKAFVFLDSTTRKTIIRMDFVSQKEFLNRLKLFIDRDIAPKVLFVLDSLFLYSPFYCERLKDADSFIYYTKTTDRQMRDALQTNTRINNVENNRRGFAVFKNTSVFQQVYSRLMTAMKDPFVFNTELSIDVRSNTIELFRSLANKQFLSYLYISENSNFFRNYFNRVQFARLERYNGKDVMIVRVANDSDKVIKECSLRQTDESVQFSAYQFVKMFNSDINIYKELFGGNEEDIVSRLMNCTIALCCQNRQLSVYFSNNSDKRIVNTLQDIFMSIFNSDEKRDDTIGYCIRKGLYFALLGKAQNYSAVLLAYLIKNHVEYFDKIQFYRDENVFSNIRYSLDNYAYVHNLIELLSSCERTVTRSRYEDLNYTYWKNGDENRLFTEIKGLIIACQKLGYTNSDIYNNLLNLY